MGGKRDRQTERPAEVEEIAGIGCTNQPNEQDEESLTGAAERGFSKRNEKASGETRKECDEKVANDAPHNAQFQQPP